MLHDLSPSRFASRRPRPVLAALLALLACALLIPVTAALAKAEADVKADAKAEVIAERTLEAMGGREAWDAARFLRFNFFGVRLHHWDRATGRHRIEGKTRDGDAYVVLHNLNTRQGEAYVNGEHQTGDEEKKWLKNAHAWWINDTYWLLMPYKLRDPGVNLTYDGEEEIDGTRYDKLKLTFDGVGLTPGDTYWAYINQETGLMDRWAFFLQDWGDDKKPSHWLWQDWKDYGGIKLSSVRKSLDNDAERPLGDLAVLDYLPDEVFTSKEVFTLP